MDETYASNVDNLNELTRQYRQSEIDKAEVMKQSVMDKFNDKLTDYSDKWKAVEEGGKDELAGQFGLKGVYRGGKKVFDLYKKYKNSKSGEADEDKPSGLEDPEADAKIDGGDRPQPPEGDDEGVLKSLGFSEEDAEGLFTEPTPVDTIATGQKDITNIKANPLDEDFEIPQEKGLVRIISRQPIQPEGDLARNIATADEHGDLGSATAPAEEAPSVQVGGAGEAPTPESGIQGATAGAEQESEKLGGSAIKKVGSNLIKETGEDIAETAGEGLGEAGGEALGATILSAIPVVGEVGLAVGGLVAIGEGIYHLFHHPHAPKVNSPVKASLVPQSVQQKYANALPSFDSSSDNMPSDAVF